MVICLERGADLHMAQLMPLPLTVSCFSKIQIGFTFLVTAHLGSPGKGPLNGCVYTVLIPSVLWYCWLGNRKGIRPVKNWVVGAGVVICLEWGAYGPADATATQSLALVKSRLALPFWFWLTWVVPEKWPLNGCVCIQIVEHSNSRFESIRLVKKIGLWIH